MTRPDFPTSLPAFQTRFASEKACFRYLVASRWPDGFVCPSCGGRAAFERGDRLALQCAACKRFYTATAGTVMHRTRQPLSHWLLAAFLMVVDKRGISALQLQRVLGLKRHEVAYQMLHKFRAAMVAPAREPLRGLIEVDETLIAGVRHGAGRGGFAGIRQIVLAAVEVRERKRPGRLRLLQLPEPRSRLVNQFLKRNVAPGSQIRTDASHLYDRVLDAGFDHDVVSVAHGAREDDVLPTLHLVFSNLKTWLQGTFHGAVRKEHLQAYLNEFAFRFNRRTNLHAAFQRILGIGTSVKGPTYAGIYEGTWEHPKGQV